MANHVPTQYDLLCTLDWAKSCLNWTDEYEQIVQFDIE